MDENNSGKFGFERVEIYHKHECGAVHCCCKHIYRIILLPTCHVTRSSLLGYASRSNRKQVSHVKLSYILPLFTYINIFIYFVDAEKYIVSIGTMLIDLYAQYNIKHNQTRK